jgi:hypothetical protein
VAEEYKDTPYVPQLPVLPDGHKLLCSSESSTTEEYKDTFYVPQSTDVHNLYISVFKPRNVF